MKFKVVKNKRQHPSGLQNLKEEKTKNPIWSFLHEIRVLAYNLYGSWAIAVGNPDTIYTCTQLYTSLMSVSLAKDRNVVKGKMVKKINK